MRKRLFWLVNDFLYWLSRGRVDLDDCLTVDDSSEFLDMGWRSMGRYYEIDEQPSDSVYDREPEAHADAE